MVERNLAKVKVAGSRPVFRSKEEPEEGSFSSVPAVEKATLSAIAQAGTQDLEGF